MVNFQQSRTFSWFFVSLAAAFSMLGAGAAETSAPAPLWQIQPKASSLTFNTTKAGAAGVGGVVETLQFTRYEGGLDANGGIHLKIDLSSIDTGIEIRDERLRTIFWKVASTPSVTFVGQIKPDDQKRLLKEALALDVEGELTMAGSTKPIKAQLLVIPADGKLWVSTRRPMVIKSADFELAAGAELLRAIMALNFLASNVPVSFQFELSAPTPSKTAAIASPAK